MGVTGSVVLCRVLIFLSVLLQDLAKLMHRRRLASLEPSMFSVSSVELDHPSSVAGIAAGASFGCGRSVSTEDMEDLLTTSLNVGHDISFSR